MAFLKAKLWRILLGPNIAIMLRVYHINEPRFSQTASKYSMLKVIKPKKKKRENRI